VEVFGVDLPKIPVSAAGLSQALSARLGCRLSQPEFCLHDDYAVMKLVSIPRFRIEYAKCTASKEGEKVCGDTVSFFETEEGCFYCLLSDGMGSGRDAALSSRLAAIMMEKLLTVGASPEDALRMLNKALQEKEKEVFATVDLLQIDRYFATATLIKAGAAPTLLFRDGNCRRFESKTPPAGIMKDVIAEKRSFKLKKGDVLLLLSDGVLQVEEGGGDLPVIHGGNAHAVANAVLSAARERTDRSDDMSVCAIRIY
jgi:stage II sporulation protein E